MQRVEPNYAGTGSTTRVWSVKDFSKRHRLDEGEEARLLQLFGAFVLPANCCTTQHKSRGGGRVEAIPASNVRFGHGRDRITASLSSPSRTWSLKDSA
jgi:hypothetical protein